MPNSPTPQAFRSSSPTIAVRQSWESELWDELSNVVYSLYFADQTLPPNTTLILPETITVPAPIASRFHISGSARALWTSTSQQDAFTGAITDGGFPTGNGFGYITFPALTDIVGAALPFTRTTDFDAGVHAIGMFIRSGAGADSIDFSDMHIEVRRGRKPAVGPQ